LAECLLGAILICNAFDVTLLRSILVTILLERRQSLAQNGPMIDVYRKTWLGCPTAIDRYRALPVDLRTINSTPRTECRFSSALPSSICKRNLAARRPFFFRILPNSSQCRFYPARFRHIIKTGNQSVFTATPGMGSTTIANIGPILANIGVVGYYS
jgi:hypothetical protein